MVIGIYFILHFNFNAMLNLELGGVQNGRLRIALLDVCNEFNSFSTSEDFAV